MIREVQGIILMLVGIVILRSGLFLTGHKPKLTRHHHRDIHRGQAALTE